MTSLSKNIEIANRNELAGTVVSPSIANHPKNRLVAHWLVDENSKLYDKWISEIYSKPKSTL